MSGHRIIRKQTGPKKGILKTRTMSVWSKMKGMLSRFVPEHVNDPLGLIWRILSSRNKAGWFALLITAAGVTLTPVDWFVSWLERKNRERETGTNSNQHKTDQAGPHIFICGPARSGTTLVYQVLARQTEVAYTCNFSSLFPRSIETASKLCQQFSNRRKETGSGKYRNYYGKTAGFASPSEANNLWNLWVEPDQSGFRTVVTTAGMQEAAEYYRYLSKSSGNATLAKNNNVNAFAGQLFSELDNSYFICMRRDSLHLAQSLIRARLDINGNINQSYGVVDASDINEKEDRNPYVEVLDQIDYLNDLAVRQQLGIGPERFWIVDYEKFCENPTDLVNRVREEILGQRPVTEPIPPIEHANKVVERQIFNNIRAEMDKRFVQTPTQKPKQRSAQDSDTAYERPEPDENRAREQSV